jgi:hypothetical protein
MKQESTIDYEQILLKDPLFYEYPLQGVNEIDLVNLLYFISDEETYNHLKIIDSYCPICKKDTTFNSEASDKEELSTLLIKAGMCSGYRESNKEITLIQELEKKGLFIRKFNCPRKPADSAHNQIFLFRVIGATLIKVGQHPTLADLVKEEIKKYRKISNEIYSELNRAIGLSAHGVGIGAFVYLRRIIEKHIVSPKINELLVEGKISNEELSKSDFKEKIKLAKDKLSPFLVENKKIYSILSKGIHELEEEECKEYFPVLRTSIEIILDEQIEKNEKEQKSKLISNQINKITS